MKYRSRFPLRRVDHHSLHRPLCDQEEDFRESSVVNMCVLRKTPLKDELCTLPDESAHILYTVRIIYSPQPSMSERSERIIQKLDCRGERTVRHGFDLVCQDPVEWQLSFRSTSALGRCPRGEESRLYPNRFPTSTCWNKGVR